ncbi:MAG: ATP-binding protein [Candidatus Pacearchaeota archaeon]
MDEQQLTRILSSMNVWWGGSEIPTSLKKAETKRKIFFSLSKELMNEKDKDILCLTGPRQVGKTTLMGQLMDFQIKEGKVDPKRIAYIVADSSLIKLNTKNVLVDSLKVYFDYVLGESPESLTSMTYIYLDEVQSLEGWASQLKSYEIYPNLKFIISGSSQTKIRNDSSESLVGRIKFRLILPFKFSEFLAFHYGDSIPKDVSFCPVNLRDAFKKSIEEGNPSFLYREVTRMQIRLSKEISRIKKLLNSYLIKGGYPGTLAYGEDYAKSLEKIKTDLDLTVYKDIYQIFNTRNSTDLMTLLTLVANSCGQKINYSKMSSSIGIDRRVVMDYLHYTSLVYLTSESKIYKHSKYKQAEKQNKAYLTDVGHRNALLGKMNEKMLSEADSGLLFQTAVYDHAMRLRFNLTNFMEHEIFYWEDGTTEVDVILSLEDSIIPIEVKSKSGDKAIGTIKKFISQHKKSKWGIIITLDELKIEENVLLMPLWAFLILC